MRLFLILNLVLAAAAAAQTGLPAPPASRPADGMRVALVTVLPGHDVYSRWGHTAIRVQNARSGYDRLFNYGTFQFDRLFVFKFAYGRLDYVLSVSDPFNTYYVYAEREGRSIIEQTLSLTPSEIAALAAFLENNARPENRVYRYDFLFDNCSTRPRDAIERVLGEKLHYAAPRDTLGATFRDLIDPFLAPSPALDTGLDLLLGVPVDRRATRREAAFLPDSLRALFARATVAGPAGPTPLVVRTDTLFWAGTGTDAHAFPLHAWLIGLVALAGLGASWKTRQGAPPRWLRRFDAALFFAVGVAGLLLAFLWFVSLHHVTGPNLNVLWAWPVHAAAAFWLGRRALPRGLRLYLGAAALVTALVCVAWLWLPQQLPAALWPLAVLLAVRAGLRAQAAPELRA